MHSKRGRLNVVYCRPPWITMTMYLRQPLHKHSSGYFYFPWRSLFCFFFFRDPQLKYTFLVMSLNFIFIDYFLRQGKASLKGLITEFPATVSLIFIAFLGFFAFF